MTLNVYLAAKLVKKLFKAESQSSEKHIAYTKYDFDSFQQEVNAKCLERKDTCQMRYLLALSTQDI